MRGFFYYINCVNIMVLNLYDNLTCLPGIGKQKETYFNKLNIFTILDLLEYYPTKINDLNFVTADELIDGKKLTVKGIIITNPVLQTIRYKKNILTFNMLVGNKEIKATFWNQNWLSKDLNVGQEICIYGIFDELKNKINGIKLLSLDTNVNLETIYSGNKWLKSKSIAKAIDLAWRNIDYTKLENLVPYNIRNKYKLLDKYSMISKIHFSNTEKDYIVAKRSAIFEEFFLYQMQLELIKKRQKSFLAESTDINTDVVRDFIKTLPFQLTSSQLSVLSEILNDMKSDFSMNRLLQGDVGSGKTIIAIISMLACITSGKQAALMAPTEILAKQHAKKIANILNKFNPEIRIEILTSSMKQKEKKYILDDLKSGDIDIIVGTHSLIQETVEYYHLGLAIIDEQHKFGVKQRMSLRTKGFNPDVLTMTATPIPRTLSITEFGDMDVSYITELPENRQPITTACRSFSAYDNILSFIKNQIANGDQAYIVVPLIEESDNYNALNVSDVFYDLKQKLGSEIQISELHGKMETEDKELIMQQFVDNKIQILVSTTIVEVGVDVPNATIMLILNADKFGLAQLHQLRGRVGRGHKKSYCILVADPKTDYGKSRLDAIKTTTNGFQLAQKDLELRGSGDLFGEKQSGLPKFKLGDPIKDLKIMEAAKKEAQLLINSSGWENNKDNQQLVNFLSRSMTKYRTFD